MDSDRSSGSSFGSYEVLSLLMWKEDEYYNYRLSFYSYGDNYFYFMLNGFV